MYMERVKVVTFIEFLLYARHYFICNSFNPHNMFEVDSITSSISQLRKMKHKEHMQDNTADNCLR